MNVTFALPVLGTTGMSANDQRVIVNQQVVAAIVCAYLEHMNATIDKGPILPANPPLTASNILAPQELGALIDLVQNAVGGIG